MDVPLARQVRIFIGINLEKHHVLGLLFGHLVRDWTQSSAVWSPSRGEEGNNHLVVLLSPLHETRPFGGCRFAHVYSPTFLFYYKRNRASYIQWGSGPALEIGVRLLLPMIAKKPRGCSWSTCVRVQERMRIWLSWG